jgi:hypothetical protein
MLVSGCEGCVSEIEKNRNQLYYVNADAKKYTEKNRVNTVVYFDGKDYQFCEETKIGVIGVAKNAIVAYHVL